MYRLGLVWAYSCTCCPCTLYFVRAASVCMGLVASGRTPVRVGLALCILFARLPVCIGVVTSGRIPVRDGLVLCILYARLLYA